MKIPDSWCHRLFNRVRAKYSIEKVERYWGKLTTAARNRAERRMKEASK